MTVPREPVRVPSAKIGLSTASAYPETCADAFALAARLGYDGVEVMVWTDPVSQDVEALRRLSKHYDMPILAIHAPTLLLTQRVWGPGPWPKVQKACELAVDLGAETVVSHPPFRWQREYAAEFVDGVAELEDKHSVTIGVENMYPWRARSREVQAYSPGWDPVVQPYRHVTWDFSHAATAQADSFAAVQALGERLSHIHLTDGSGSPKDEHLLPGRGTQRAADTLEYLAEQAWDGLVILEVNTRKAKTRADRESDLAESLAFARLHMAAPAGAAG